MTRRSHPKQDIESALKYAEQHGWRISVGGGHAWGKMYCPKNDQIVAAVSIVLLQ